MNSLFAHPLFKDIRFWILLFFMIRLMGITNPPLEVAHNWRQTTVTMVARNFLEVSNNPFYPRIDFAGEKTGITGMEFPVFNYVCYWFSELFGYQHWYGRLINLLVSSIGIWYFFKIIKRYFTPQIAFNAAFILMVSIWFAYSRKIMPDTFATSLFTIGFYYGSAYFERKENTVLHLTLFFMFTLLGILAKLPIGFLMILYCFFVFNKKIPFQRIVIFNVLSGIMLAPVAWWYFSWVPHLVKQYGFWHFFMGKPITTGAVELIQHWNDALKHFYDAALKYVGFSAFLIGLFFIYKRRNKRLALLFILCSLAFLIIMLKAGFTFTHHAYYIIPFVPIMALIAAYGIDEIPLKKIQLLFLALIAIEGVGNQLHDFRIKDHEMAFTRLEASLDSISSKRDLIAINTGDNPTAMYFAHRKGWIAWNEELKQTDFQNQLASKGCRFIVVMKRYLGGELELPLSKVVDNENWSIYSLTASQGGN